MQKMDIKIWNTVFKDSFLELKKTIILITTELFFRTVIYCSKRLFFLTVFLEAEVSGLIVFFSSAIWGCN
jgi:hypothetical protein